MTAAPRASPAPRDPQEQQSPAAGYQAELDELAVEARERRSVDSFARAALIGFAWAVLAGIAGKLLWDSERPPLFFWPLVALDLALLWEACKSFLRGRKELRREVAVLDRVRELRIGLGLDPAEMRSGVLPALRPDPLERS